LGSELTSGSGETITYDLKGLKCPLPVLKTRKRMAALPLGTRVVVETTDPMAVIDIPHFCQESGNKLISTETVESGHRFCIEKA